MKPNDLPKKPANAQLAYYWERPVSELVGVVDESLEPGESERHTICSLLVMSLVAALWNGNKRGQTGNYPWRSNQKLPNGIYRGGLYLGHNIACIAVDGNGDIIDFEFNHNEVFNSSSEHAESRLVRRIFNLNQIYDAWNTKMPHQVPPSGYGNVLSNVTVYTSLESCAQCSGVMTLGNLKDVVYLQADPGQYMIGNIMYNLTRPVVEPMTESLLAAPVQKYGAPRPIDASLLGFKYKQMLDEAFVVFGKQVKSDPDKYFYRAEQGGKVDKSVSITSFLCTDVAFDIFMMGSHEFDTISLSHPDYHPATSGEGARSNRELLAHARSFRNHVVNNGRRATPHR